MKLGFVSAILPDLGLEAVLGHAARLGYDCVELMCWPPGRADRRYAGVTHLDVTGFTPDMAARTRQLCQTAGVAISGLGYYPNPLSPDMAQLFDRILTTIANGICQTAPSTPFGLFRKF